MGSRGVCMGGGTGIRGGIRIELRDPVRDDAGWCCCSWRGGWSAVGE